MVQDVPSTLSQPWFIRPAVLIAGGGRCLNRRPPEGLLEVRRVMSAIAIFYMCSASHLPPSCDLLFAELHVAWPAI